ncbi:MAG: histidine kinase N-terminal domain-containing protein [Hornefia sp.]|nr:histidine kinase N-terminal domain-containing protein [Hornefia sp.]
MDVIQKLCSEYTNLNQEEIKEIKEASRTLSAMANLFNADAFIDCRLSDGSGDAIVVAEAKPIDCDSSYTRTVVGLIATKEKEPAVYRSLQLGVGTKHMKAMTQENVHVIQTVEPIYHKDRIIGVFIIEQKMEQNVHSYKPLEKEEQAVEDNVDDVTLLNDNKNITDNIEEGLLFVGYNNKIIFRNKSASMIFRRLGFINDILGEDYKDISLVPMPCEGGCKFGINEVVLGNFHFIVKTVDVDREDIDYAVTISDITTRKMQEKELVLKSVAFKEMHHRVKNNLQTVAALLRLQRNTISSEEGKQALNETITRILAISSTHEILIENDVEEVMLNDIIASVKENTLVYFNNDNIDLKVECYGGDFKIKFEKATALALILNELMQNSLKYAFKGRNKGKISLMTMQRRADDIELVFLDDGCGFNIKKTTSGSMGWTIIRSLVKEKLNGHLTVRSNNSGTRVKIVF